MHQLREEEFLLKDIGDRTEKFSIIYNRSYQPIFNYVLKRTLNFEISRDITSEVFIKAFVNIGRFKWKGISVSNWLYRIATNEINLYFRSKKYKPELLLESYHGYAFEKQIYNLEEERQRAEKELLDHQQFMKIQEQLKKLPLHYQEVITLKYFEQLKIKEISEILNKKEGTVKSLISRGLSKLKDLLGQPY